MKEKTPLPHEVECFQMLDLTSRPQNLIWRSRNQIHVENYFFLKNYVTLEGTASHNVLYCQPLPITRYQIGFVRF